MARRGAHPQDRQAVIRARVRSLILLVPLITLEFVTLSGPPSRAGQLALGVAFWFAVVVLSTALTLTLGVALRARVIWLSIGFGPRLSRRVIGNHVRVVRLLPITIGGGVLPTKRFALVWRIFTGSYLVLPVVFTAVAAMLLPGWTALSMVVFTALFLILTATSRDSASGRMIVSRVVIAPKKQTDPALARADRSSAAGAAIDAQFGDFVQAESVLTRLRAKSDTALSVALLTVELLAARGEYDSALRVPFPQPDPADAPKLAESQAAMNSARSAKLMLLAAERDPQLAAKALSMADSHLRSVAASRMALQQDRTGRALLALSNGDVRTATRANRVCMARAHTPLALADALCTGARIEAVRGHRAKAAKYIDEAVRLAPWYPRVMTVRQILGAEAATIEQRPLPTGAGTDTTHVFAEPWSVAGSAPEDG
jgi:hypothetical protein